MLCSWCTLLIAICHGIEIKGVWQCLGGRKEERKHAEHSSCFPLLELMAVSDMWKADRRVQREWGHRSLREHVLGIQRGKAVLGTVQVLVFGVRHKKVNRKLIWKQNEVIIQRKRGKIACWVYTGINFCGPRLVYAGWYKPRCSLPKLPTWSFMEKLTLKPDKLW